MTFIQSGVPTLLCFSKYTSVEPILLFETWDINFSSLSEYDSSHPVIKTARSRQRVVVRRFMTEAWQIMREMGAPAVIGLGGAGSTAFQFLKDTFTGKILCFCDLGRGHHGSL